jgi:hypothetical protein
VYRGIASIGTGGVATIAAVKTWARALAKKGQNPGDPLYADLRISFLVANAMITSDGTTLTATTHATGGTAPRALKRTNVGDGLEFDLDFKAERTI